MEENPDAFPWFEKLPDHNDWPQLPDGSFVLYDEAHSDGNTQGLERYGRLFPSTGKPGESEHPRIRSMSTHRHRGFDLAFVTQWPSKIHHQVRSLIGSHTHMNRAFGMQRSGVLTWTRAQADPYTSAYATRPKKKSGSTRRTSMTGIAAQRCTRSVTSSRCLSESGRACQWPSP
ncbi:zonular occludens toxin domain-containing protein [Stenotrophomonas sp. A3_2]|uniref:zonular occludens toxin domain-containing protein n=1 Tax=Stenotrophomonas sp. A3_2 TaxID=3119978 RepID=UPI002FC3A4B7